MSNNPQLDSHLRLVPVTVLIVHSEYRGSTGTRRMYTDKMAAASLTEPPHSNHPSQLPMAIRKVTAVAVSAECCRCSLCFPPHRRPQSVSDTDMGPKEATRYPLTTVTMISYSSLWKRTTMSFWGGSVEAGRTWSVSGCCLYCYFRWHRRPKLRCWPRSRSVRAS